MFYFNLLFDCNQSNTKPVIARYVGSVIDNLHYDFLKQYNYIPRESLKSLNSNDIYLII